MLLYASEPLVFFARRWCREVLHVCSFPRIRLNTDTVNDVTWDVRVCWNLVRVGVPTLAHIMNTTESSTRIFCSICCMNVHDSSSNGSCQNTPLAMWAWENTLLPPNFIKLLSTDDIGWVRSTLRRLLPVSPRNTSPVMGKYGIFTNDQHILADWVENAFGSWWHAPVRLTQVRC